MIETLLEKQAYHKSLYHNPPQSTRSQKTRGHFLVSSPIGGVLQKPCKSRVFANTHVAESCPVWRAIRHGMQQSLCGAGSRSKNHTITFVISPK